MMSALISRLVATESASSGEPKSAPSDMLITSAWSDGSPSPFGSAALSMAAPTTSDAPAQPNTHRTNVWTDSMPQ
jgi:hypothetical protein